MPEPVTQGKNATHRRQDVSSVARSITAELQPTTLASGSLNTTPGGLKSVAYRNKTYIAFDADTDMSYYRMMTAWHANPRFSFEFHNAHDLNTARDSSEEESIKRQLRERFANSKNFIVLIGENTRLLRKFVPWEMEVALKLDLPIIGVNLNGSRVRDERCPTTIFSELVIYIPFGAKIIEYALEHWPASHATYKAQKKTGAHCYNDGVYESLESTK